MCCFLMKERLCDYSWKTIDKALEVNGSFPPCPKQELNPGPCFTGEAQGAVIASNMRGGSHMGASNNTYKQFMIRKLQDIR